MTRSENKTGMVVNYNLCSVGNSVKVGKCFFSENILNPYFLKLKTNMIQLLHY
jgi:hypothetical protein